MKELKIKVPTFSDFSRWGEIIKFKINGGFKCDCGNTMFFDHIYLNGNGFLFENFTKNMCIECTLTDINDNSDKIFKSFRECDWCKEYNPTVGWMKGIDIKSQIIFGQHWWNGKHICQSCLNEQIIKHKDTQTSSRIEFDKNEKMRAVNSLGMLKP